MLLVQVYFEKTSFVNKPFKWICVVFYCGFLQFIFDNTTNNYEVSQVSSFFRLNISDFLALTSIYLYA